MEAQYKPFEERGRPTVLSIWYRDRPSPGWGTGLTYGASLLGHPHIELMIVVRSRDPAWAWALAHFVDAHRDSVSQLAVGDTITWGERIARHSKMDAFFIGLRSAHPTPAGSSTWPTTTTSSCCRPSPPTPASSRW